MNEFVDRWMKEIAPEANVPCILHVEADGRAWIGDEDGDVATACSDWNCLLTAPSLDALGNLCKIDLA